ncbi:MAG: ATP-binding protein, partial [Roseibium sp.]
PVELSIASAESEEGEIFVSFLRDVSKRVEAEQDLIKARDDAVAGEKAKVDLIAVMSHEMRTPLNGMLGTLQLIDPENLSRKEKEYIEIIGASGKLLLHHVENVLEISRAEAGMMEVSNTVFSVPLLINELVESQRSVAEHRGNTLTQTLDTRGAGYACGDPTRVRQIVLNLIGNAIKFTRNGSISVEAKRLDDREMVEFRVTDTGIGIAQQDRARIFEEFVTLDASYSREVGGTGLGLAIVKRLVEALGGEVGLDSSEGTGSSFWVHLPMPAENVENLPLESEATQQKKPDTRNLAPMKILVVEDNRINRIVVRDLLEKDGHHVDEAVDGEKGLKCTQTSAYDLILMDISMPNMDGLEATTAIRKVEEKGATVPIIALTAHAMPSEIKRFLAAGMDGILTKPVSLQKLRDILLGISINKKQSAVQLSLSAPDPSDEVINHTHLNELVGTLGAEKTKTMMSSFLSEMEIDISQIISLIDTGQFPESLREKVHHAAGSAAMLGAKSLHAALCNLETKLRELESDNEISGDDLKSIWAKTARELRQRV